MTMTYLEAAITVLRASGHPMTTSEIVERITSGDLIQVTGQTPARTLAAALYRNLGKHPQLRREAKMNKVRAARGTVRWYLDG
jgi:HB1, ASXL, restriction endonuclease HTH domain